MTLTSHPFLISKKRICPVGAVARNFVTASNTAVRVVSWVTERVKGLSVLTVARDASSQRTKRKPQLGVAVMVALLSAQVGLVVTAAVPMVLSAVLAVRV